MAIIGNIKRGHMNKFCELRQDYIDSFKPYFDEFIRKHVVANQHNIDQLQQFANDFIHKHSLPIRINVIAHNTTIHIIGADWISECVWDAITSCGILETIHQSS